MPQDYSGRVRGSDTPIDIQPRFRAEVVAQQKRDYDDQPMPSRGCCTIS